MSLHVYARFTPTSPETLHLTADLVRCQVTLRDPALRARVDEEAGVVVIDTGESYDDCGVESRAQVPGKLFYRAVRLLHENNVPLLDFDGFVKSAGAAEAMTYGLKDTRAGLSGCLVCVKTGEVLEKFDDILLDAYISDT